MSSAKLPSLASDTVLVTLFLLLVILGARSKLEIVPYRMFRDVLFYLIVIIFFYFIPSLFLKPPSIPKSEWVIIYVENL